MWFIECEGEVLGGKRLWLRPNQRFAIGRTPSNDINLSLPSQKSISRVHLLIDVGEITEGDGVKLSARPTVTVQDHKTKHGTRVDGNEIRDQTVTLGGTEHFFHLGKYEPAFRLYWNPTIFSVSLSSKERKDKKVMTRFQRKMESLGIKTFPTFVPATTHVVASKRNTAIGLQALVNGRHIVMESYLDAIAAVASIPPGGKQSALEQDFDQNWPDPEDFLPPSNNEPGNRSPDFYRPNKERNGLFEGYTFVFCETLQYDNFLGPITDAHGKLELFNLQPGETTAEDLVQFVKKRGQGTNVAIVRFRGKKDPEWENQLSTRVQEMLGYRMVEQNEFLDIILTGDKSGLKKPLEGYSQAATLPAIPGSSLLPGNGRQELSSTFLENRIAEETQLPASSAEVAGRSRPAMRSRGRTRTRVIPTLIDPFSMNPSGPLQPLQTQEPPITAQLVQGQENSATTLHVGEPAAEAWNTLTEIDELPQVDSHGLSLSQLPGRNRKRNVQPEHQKDQTLDVMDLLPGAQAIKRRKFAEEEERALRGETTQEPPSGLPPVPKPTVKASEKLDASPPPKSKGKKTQKAEDPYIAKAREIKERENAAAMAAKEQELAAMEGLDVEQLKNLAIVEVMEVKPRTDKPTRGGYGDEGARWEDRWNGRKNFKKFVRAGRGGGMRTMRANVMVNLVEHKGRDYGIGDGYWMDNEDETPVSKRNQRTLGQRSQGNSGPQSSDSDSMRTPNPNDPPETQTQMQTRTRTKTRPARAGEQSSTGQGAKRPAIVQGSRSNSGKKQKTLTLRDESEDDESEDDLKFTLKGK